MQVTERIHVADTNPKGKGGMFFELTKDGKVKVTISETKGGGRTYLTEAEIDPTILVSVLEKLGVSPTS